MKLLRLASSEFNPKHSVNNTVSIPTVYIRDHDAEEVQEVQPDDSGLLNTSSIQLLQNIRGEQSVPGQDDLIARPVL